MPHLARFTAAEAAFVLREPIRAVKKAFDHGPVQPTLAVRLGVSVRVIDRADLFYLFAVGTLRASLTPAAREEFHKAVRRPRPYCDDEVRFGRFRVAVADLADKLEQRIAELTEVRRTVAFGEDGAPVLGSRGVRLHRIAALLRGGMSVNAILEEFPFLSRTAVDQARLYAQVYPRPGRPYPRTTANRATRATGQP